MIYTEKVNFFPSHIQHHHSYQQIKTGSDGSSCSGTWFCFTVLILYTCVRCNCDEPCNNILLLFCDVFPKSSLFIGKRPSKCQQCGKKVKKVKDSVSVHGYLSFVGFIIKKIICSINFQEQLTIILVILSFTLCAKFLLRAFYVEKQLLFVY